MTLRSCFGAIPRKWKTPTTLRVLFALELICSIPALALYGIAQPDLYRTKFWQEGSDHGWNSSPDEILYAYANYKPIDTPLPWSKFTTYFSVIVSVVTIFVLLLKIIMTVMHVFWPIVSLFVHAGLIAIWAVAIHNQAASDMSDPKHPQPGAPWYITKSCSEVNPDLDGYCKQAKSAFAITVILCALQFGYLILTLISLYPTKDFRASRRAKLTDQEARYQPWEMLEAPKTPGTSGGLRSPTTPTTKAFNKLSRKGNQNNGKESGKAPERQGNVGIPLKHHVSMGDDEAYRSPEVR